jgi:hypothetical protein
VILLFLNEFVSVFALIAEAVTKAQADQSASISLVAPSLLEIYWDLDSEQATLKYAGGLCKALLKSMHDRFGGLLKQFGLSDGITPNIRSTSELYSDSFFLIAPFLDIGLVSDGFSTRNYPTTSKLAYAKQLSD